MHHHTVPEFHFTCATPQIRLTNVPIVGGIAYLCNHNVMIMGGAVPELQKLHRRRFFEELSERMDEDELNAVVLLSSCEPPFQADARLG